MATASNTNVSAPPQKGINGFATRLYTTMTNGKDENFFVSPYSISTALSMCCIAARNETAKQLKSVLCFVDMSNDQINNYNEDIITRMTKLGFDVTLHVAYKIYPQIGFTIKKEFNEAIKNKYHSEVQQLNFTQSAESTKAINDYVSQKTKGKVKDLVSPGTLNSLTRLVLVNAIYFKGKWQQQFDKSATTKEDFTLRDGSKAQVEMMQMTSKKFKLLKHDELKVKVCELPYKGSAISMSIILPNESTTLDALEGQLNDVTFKNVLQQNKEMRSVNLSLPKFKIEYKDELSRHLKAMGAPLPFDEYKADFTGINDSPQGLCISQVIHQAVVEMNEEGTEAAAATAVVIRTKAKVIQVAEATEDFICNRPFLFIIHEKQANTILFIGKYMKPASLAVPAATATAT